MTEYWSGSITFTGLGSGTDFDSIIEATMEVERYRLNRMETWDAMWSSKLEQVQRISEALSDYKTALKNLNSLGEFLAKTASSSNTSVLSATAGATASEGTHEVVVGQKAQNDIWTTTAGWDSADSVVTTEGGTFAVEYDGETLTLDVPAGTTLDGLVALINAHASMGNSIRASLINDGEQMHLQLRGLDLGAAHAVTILDQGDEALDGLAAGDFEHSQQAQNAKIKVDGYPAAADAWIERETNTISDVIEGVSITLRGVSDGQAVEISVETDTETIIANIESFLEQTNALRDAIRLLDESYTDENGDTVDTTGYMVRGNYGMDIIEQTLQNILSSRGLGFLYYDPTTGSGDVYASLSSVGITTDADENSATFGHLVIEYDVLEAALADDAGAVARLFASENDGVSYDACVSYGSSVATVTKAGAYEVTYTVADGQLVGATIDGQTANVDGWEITSTAGDASGLAVFANIREDGTYTGTVYLRQGKINQTLDAVTSFSTADKGTLQIIEDSYQTIIDNNLAAIEKEEARLAIKQQRLIERYAALEALLGTNETLNTSLESQLSNLSTFA
ncbi:MAG: flagellar filament capping protein FliD [Desulfovibrio sp.]|nr:flagellar filament capping protein FliD [Desulfovibrio sp.]